MRGVCIECLEVSDNFKGQEKYCSIVCREKAKVKKKLENWANGTSKRASKREIQDRGKASVR